MYTSRWERGRHRARATSTVLVLFVFQRSDAVALISSYDHLSTCLSYGVLIVSYLIVSYAPSSSLSSDKILCVVNARS